MSSRDITLRYRSHANDTAPVATARVRLRVRAGLRLSIHPRTATRGAVIRFVGRLLGRPVPRAGKQIVLTVRSARGPWHAGNLSVLETRVGVREGIPAKDGCEKDSRTSKNDPTTFELRILCPGWPVG